MNQNIFNLIKVDLKLSQCIHCLKVCLDMNADGLTTDNILVILSLMRVKPDDEVLKRYFELVQSVNEINSDETREQLIETIFHFLLNCQTNPDLVLRSEARIQVGAFALVYAYQS